MKVNRKPKNLILDSDQKALLGVNDIILVFDYRKLTATKAKILSTWLLKASIYLKNKKEPKTRTTGSGFIY